MALLLPLLHQGHSQGHQQGPCRPAGLDAEAILCNWLCDGHHGQCCRTSGVNADWTCTGVVCIGKALIGKAYCSTGDHPPLASMFQVVGAECNGLCKHLLCHNSVPVVHHVALAAGGRLLLSEGHHAPTIMITVGLCCMHGIALPYSVDTINGWLRLAVQVHHAA